VQELLDKSELAVVSLVIRQALQGDHASERLLVDLYGSLPRNRRSRVRVGKMRSAEDLMNVVERATQEVSRGEITPAEAKATLDGVAQQEQLLEERTKEEKTQGSLKQPLPEFMREGLEAARAERLRKAKAEDEKKLALAGNRDQPP